MIRAGDTIAERYRVTEQLGAGGAGVVWRARDTKLDRDVAVKVLSAHMLARGDALARFEREARVGAHVHHPHVIATYDFGRAGELVYLVLQLLPDGDLRAYVDRHHPLSILSVCRIAHQVADALCAAHAAGVIHRDLKPENVLVETVDPLHVRVADFGMAYVEAAGDPRDGRVTGEGQFGGTVAYMAPEQIVDQQVGAPSDIYALGCMVFELVTGVPPFTGAASALIAKHVYAPPMRLASVCEVPSGLDELVDRMLAKSPALRPSADNVRTRLEHLLDGLGDAAGAGRAGREQRMVSQQAGPAPRLEAAAPEVRVGIRGTLPADAMTALVAAGFTVGGPAAPGDDAAAWIVTSPAPDDVAALVATGVPVVATARRDDFARVAAWLRLGVADVVFEPVAAAALVGKVQSALARRRR